MGKPVCQLVGTDGNVFSIIAKVARTLRGAKQFELEKEFVAKATSSESYAKVLMLVHDYVEVK